MALMKLFSQILNEDVHATKRTLHFVYNTIWFYTFEWYKTCKNSAKQYFLLSS